MGWHLEFSVDCGFQKQLEQWVVESCPKISCSVSAILVQVSHPTDVSDNGEVSDMSFVTKNKNIKNCKLFIFS